MSNSYLERYQGGDLKSVWLELGNLCESQLDPITLEDVQAVTHETIRRVRHNLELIAAKLLAMGFEFGDFEIDPPIPRSHPIEPLEKPQQLLNELSSVVGGPVPLVFRVFAEQIGDVDFRGRHPKFKSNFLLDALMFEIFAPDPEEVQHWLEHFRDDPSVDGYWHPFAPDNYHKENISGGSPYSIRLPDDQIDPPVLDTPIDGSFIDYLRDSILTFACFPGFADIPADLLEHLRADLIAF